MDWLAQVVANLAELPTWGYARTQPSSSEPAAATALALTLAEETDAASAPLDWLQSIQAQGGDIGISAAQREPRWPTAWALTAWTVHDQISRSSRYRSAAEKAVGWLLQMSGETMERNPDFGHDSSLAGWPWVHHTHSWQEPTAFAVMALKRSGHGDHSRAREGVKVLIDRLLETGGCNYGNTVVLGQTLRPHVQPTGLCLLALSGERDRSRKVQKSIGWLARAIGPQTTPVSLSYALLGLAAHNHLPVESDDWLRAAALRELARESRPYVLALLALAAQHGRGLRSENLLTSNSNHG